MRNVLNLLQAVVIAFLTGVAAARGAPAGLPPGLGTVSLDGHAHALDSWWLAEPVTTYPGQEHTARAVFGYQMYSWGAIVNCKSGQISWQPRASFDPPAPRSVVRQVAQAACHAQRYVLTPAGWRLVTARP